jgi:hypothetical protein
MCLFWWENLEEALTTQLVLLPPGWAVASHLSGYHPEIYKAFNDRLIPDIFAGHCSESTYGFLASAISRRWMLLNCPVVIHHPSMDGPNLGFDIDNHRGDYGYFLKERPRECVDILADPEFKASGMGYEECRSIAKHDPELYNKLGIVKDPKRLRDFILANFFVPVEFYRNIKYDLILNDQNYRNISPNML